MLISDIEPGGGGGDALYSLHSEEEFVFILTGSVTILVESDEVRLEEGDAMTFDPRRRHTFRNSSKTECARALFVLSPPPV
ncbi:MAG: cupin domain-containing protein [Burkholderiales bacterium]